MQIKSIKAADGGSLVRLTLSASDGERITLSLAREYAETLSLRIGECDEQTYSTLVRLDRLTSAVRCGWRILSYGANSKSALTSKLRAKGFSQDIADEATELLVRHSKMDESEDAMRFCELALKKNLGASRILKYLKSRGYGDEALGEVKKHLSAIDFSEICYASLIKKYRTLPRAEDEKKRCVAYLLRQGFTYSDIRRAIEREQ